MIERNEDVIDGLNDVIGELSDYANDEGGWYTNQYYDLLCELRDTQYEIYKYYKISENYVRIKDRNYAMGLTNYAMGVVDTLDQLDELTKIHRNSKGEKQC